MGQYGVVFLQSFRAKGYNRCEPCPGVALRRVMLLAFGAHKKAYGHTWGA